MTTREDGSQRVQRTSVLSPCHVLRQWWWWWGLVLVWWCSLLRCAAEQIGSSNLQHGPSKNSRNLDKDYFDKESGSCSNELPLIAENNSSCVSEKNCKESRYAVYWMKQQCLFKCPPGYISIDGYCSFTDVCKTVRISSLEKLENLKNCRIVEGSIEIVLIKDASEDEWEQWSFPDLVEVTEFLLVYKVEGLRNLGQLFPNLAVIRGTRLLLRYSLVIYSTHLEDIGLHSLQAILRGSVRIQNNINLCYVHTVNWDAIVNDSNDNVLTMNSEPLCKDCCPSCSSGQSQEPHCQYCWNSTTKQQICSQCEHGCTADHQCCHQQCVGGCKAPHNDYACHACLHYNTGDRCVENCGSLLQYKGYRCVRKKYCQEEGFMQFNGTQCVAECPEGYEPVRNKTEGMLTCSECKNCGKACHGLLVDTVARAQELQGCTTINGSLIISIRYGKTVTRELEASLGAIQRVTHYVRIFKTSPLKSLNFLLNLKVIEGRKLYNNKYALFVHENANLEDIWDFSKKQELNINKGKILFLANPKLCYNNKIEKLLSLTGQEEDFNMHLTNGNKVACSIMKHAITLVPRPIKGLVMVSWTPVSTNEDNRKITGYFIYYKETNETNIGHMDGRDACNDEWKRKHAQVKDSIEQVKVALTYLKPFTRYAVYVETDTVADADIGARSNISYTTTMPFNPSKPLRLSVRDKGTSYIVVEWSPPSSPNGQISEYIVSRTLQKYEEDTCQDLCQTEQVHSGRHEESDKNAPESTSNRSSGAAAATAPPQSPAPPSQCCPCPEESHPEEDDEIDFKDRLHNHIYLHRIFRENHIIRGKRSILLVDDAPSLDNSVHNPSWQGPAADYVEYQEETLDAENGTLRSKTNTYNLTGLSHYSRYLIEVSACHKPLNEPSECPPGMQACQLCSTFPARIVETTAKKDSANMVVDLRVEDITQSTVRVAWSPPLDPNGQVLAYKVFVSSVAGNTRQPMYCEPSCKANQSQDTYYFQLDSLSPATEYRLRVEAYTRAPVDINDTAAVVLFITKAETSDDRGQILLIVAIFLLVAIMCGILVFRRVQPPTLSIDEEVETGPDYADIPAQYVVKQPNLRLEEGSLLGKGNFGVVFKGQLKQGCEWVPVAVKQARNLPSQKDMLLEAKLTLELRAYHIVHAYGVMIKPDHTYLVMEYMSKGDLLNYLRQRSTKLEIEEVCVMALQIADGMAYLASRNYVHRDLAARNCLIGDNMKVKISDFGMTRITDYVLRSQFFPVRWIAPECFNEQRFTTQSDVWSYGIVLWEILTKGRTPYEDLHTNDDVREMVSSGHTLKSNVCSSTTPWLADLICSCWELEAHERPSFLNIISILLPHVSPYFMQRFRSVSFYHQKKGQ